MTAFVLLKCIKPCLCNVEEIKQDEDQLNNVEIGTFLPDLNNEGHSKNTTESEEGETHWGSTYLWSIGPSYEGIACRRKREFCSKTPPKPVNIHSREDFTNGKFDQSIII